VLEVEAVLNPRPPRTSLLARSQNPNLSDRRGAARQLTRANVPPQLARPMKEENHVVTNPAARVAASGT
jgi:hypothetical protein